MKSRPTAAWSDVDLPLALLWVHCVLDVRRISDLIAKQGEVIDGKVHPLVNIRAARERTLLSVATRLRLTPASRHTGKDAARFDRHAKRAGHALDALEDDSDDLLAGQEPRYEH